MTVTVQRRTVLWAAVAALIGAALLLAMTSGVFGSGQAQAASASSRAQVDLVIANTSGESLGDWTLTVSNIGSSGEDGVRSSGGGRFQVDSFFDIAYAIGSSGLDGVTASSFNVDSFFDIEYRIDTSSSGGTWDTEMISMSLTGSYPSSMNPGDVLDQIREEIAASKKGRVFHGHVTVLK